ncbi:MAG: M48 family metallopeptidase [Rhizonema sp. PD37]|nr:M48 family metallopeptidase [Rhizonema sp. PD37]
MTRKILHGIRVQTYQHPLDRKALVALEKMPGLPLLLKKINEYGIDRLLRMQTKGGEFRVSPRNFPSLHNALVETCKILDSPQPDLYLYRGEGHISTYAIGVEKPLVGINIEAMEWLSGEELLFVLGHEIARIEGRYLNYQQLAVVMPLLKNLISSTTLGLGGLAASGLEVALFNWIVMAKFTADRAGLLACQDVDVAMTALIKLGGLPEEYINPEVKQDFLAQAREFDIDDLDRLDQVTKIFSFMEYQYPWVVMRASELLKWVDSGMYEQLGRSIEPQPELEHQEQQPEEWNFLSSW